MIKNLHSVISSVNRHIHVIVVNLHIPPNDGKIRFMPGEFSIVDGVDGIGHINESHKLTCTYEGVFLFGIRVSPSPDVVEDATSSHFQISSRHAGEEVNIAARMVGCQIVYAFYT